MWYTATHIYTPSGWVTDFAIHVDESGMIIDMGALPAGEQAVALKGLLVPGFVNAHCHLELSGLAGTVSENTGMAGFVQQLLSARQELSDEEAEKAAGDAMDIAYESGTVAFGDICNGPLSIKAKRIRPHIFTHSFIELLGMDAEKAGLILENGKTLAGSFGDLVHSLTLHAPYSISPPLRDKFAQTDIRLRSFHLYESREEVDLFLGKGGGLSRFLQKIPAYNSFAFPPGDPASYLLKNTNLDASMLWVHLAEIKASRLAGLATHFPKAYACLCPRANYYIHRSVPDADMFQRIMPERICIGTDSLAGNFSLNMLEEVAHLQQHFPHIKLHTLLKWATTNGAAALGIDDQYGTFVPGTRPGLVHIPQEDPDRLNLGQIATLVI